MKILSNGVIRRNSNSFALLFLAGFLFTGCSKQAFNAERGNSDANLSDNESNVFRSSPDLSEETIWELQQAKKATAKYNNFENAIKDQYVDINVVVPEMGYHFLRLQYLDGTFDYAKPEILVYNKEANGKMKLVALEYAVPIDASPGAPAGFTGSHDNWAVYEGTLWTLHAWVWEYNPAGVFNATNPLIHLH